MLLASLCGQGRVWPGHAIALAAEVATCGSVRLQLLAAARRFVRHGGRFAACAAFIRRNIYSSDMVRQMLSIELGENERITQWLKR